MALSLKFRRWMLGNAVYRFFYIKVGAFILWHESMWRMCKETRRRMKRGDSLLGAFQMAMDEEDRRLEGIKEDLQKQNKELKEQLRIRGNK